MKKILAVLLAVLLILTAVGCESPSSGGSVSSVISRSPEHTFEACEGGYRLVSAGSKYKTDATVSIPEEYNGQPVVSIGADAFAGFSALESIVIPNTVTEIQKRAFSGCTSLTAVRIPDSVVTIQGGAFMNCTSHKAKPDIPMSAQVDENTFDGCNF